MEWIKDVFEVIREMKGRFFAFLLACIGEGFMLKIILDYRVNKQVIQSDNVVEWASESILSGAVGDAVAIIVGAVLVTVPLVWVTWYLFRGVKEREYADRIESPLLIIVDAFGGILGFRTLWLAFSSTVGALFAGFVFLLFFMVFVAIYNRG